MKQKKISGTEKFNAYYSGIYGERWEGLKAALLKEKDTVSLSDLLSEPYYMDKASIFAASVLPLERYSCGSSASPKKSESADPANIKDNPNSFDPAKDIAAGVSNASCETQESASSQSVKILDMCAAPGGKSLVIALKLMHSKTDWHLTANDRSPDRRARLASVLKTSLPPEICERISITGHDATRWGLYEKNVYDAILLDAPCSSERHVIQSEKALSEWSPHRPKELQIRQYAMLSAAFDAAKTGGYILYSTCSINPEENSEVIKKLFKRKQGKVAEDEYNPSEPGSLPGYIMEINLPETGELPLVAPKIEKCERGYVILPDKAGGLGPIYFCLLKKIGE